MKIAEDDSKSIPNKLQLLDSRVQSVVTNQSQVFERLKKLGLTLEDNQGRLVALNTSINQDRHGFNSQAVKLSEVRQDLELSEAHAETLTQELVDARVLASKAEALSEQRQAEAEERSSLASKVEEAERLLAEERSKVEELVQELDAWPWLTRP